MALFCHVTHDKIAFSEDFFQRLVAVFVSWQTETVVQTKRKYSILFYAKKYKVIMAYTKNHGVFCHVTHDKIAFSEVFSNDW